MIYKRYNHSIKNEVGRSEIMGRANIEMIEVNLNKFAEDSPEEGFKFNFDIEKQSEYTVKYVASQEHKRYDELSAKYPYFRFRGLPVDPKVAKDIICKTDMDYEEVSDNTYHSIENINFVNKWACLSGFKGISPFGWCHPDGTIGYNSVTSKYSDCLEILDEIVNIKLDFPFLEFMVALTWWNERPIYAGDIEHSIRVAYENEDEAEEAAEDWAAREIYPDFSDNVELLIYAHNKTFEIYWNEEACEVYKELLPKLQNKPDIKYVNQYYESIWVQEEGINDRFEKEVPADEKELLEKGLISYEALSYKHFLINYEMIEQYRLHNNIGRCFGTLKRKPYFRIVGKPITPEQAAEFIKKTDEIIPELFEKWKYNEKYYKSYDVRNEYKHLPLKCIKTSVYASNISIIRPDGIIDSEGISNCKYPLYHHFLDDMKSIAEAFPFLDFVIVVTCWNEQSPFEWNWDDYIKDIEAGRKTEEEVDKIREIEDDIYKAIHTCIWVHDGTADWFYSKYAEGIEKLKNYMKLYHKENDDISCGQCLLNMGTDKIEYFKKMLSYYGIPEGLMGEINYELHY